jgi:hypothetical protein
VAPAAKGRITRQTGIFDSYVVFEVLRHFWVTDGCSCGAALN